MSRLLMSTRLAMAVRLLDQAWPLYDGELSEAGRDFVITEAVEVAFPEHGLALTEADVLVLAAAAKSARRSQVELFRMVREAEELLAKRPNEHHRMAVYGTEIAARLAADWVRLVDRVVLSICRYQTVSDGDAVPAARQRDVQRFARWCASELGIKAPQVRWIRPADDGGDLVTLGDIAGCAPRRDQSVIFVRCDIPDDHGRFRVVAHEVAHHAGADERGALAFEAEALARQSPLAELARL